MVCGAAALGVASFTFGGPGSGVFWGPRGSVAIWAQIARRIRHSCLFDSWVAQALDITFGGISYGRVLSYFFGVFVLYGIVPFVSYKLANAAVFESAS